MRVLSEYLNKKNISVNWKANWLYLLSICTLFEDVKMAKQWCITALRIWKQHDFKNGIYICKIFASKIIIKDNFESLSQQNTFEPFLQKIKTHTQIEFENDDLIILEVS